MQFRKQTSKNSRVAKYKVVKYVAYDKFKRAPILKMAGTVVIDADAGSEEESATFIPSKTTLFSKTGLRDVLFVGFAQKDLDDIKTFRSLIPRLDINDSLADWKSDLFLLSGRENIRKASFVINGIAGSDPDDVLVLDADDIQDIDRFLLKIRREQYIDKLQTNISQLPESIELARIGLSENLVETDADWATALWGAINELTKALRKAGYTKKDFCKPKPKKKIQEELF